MGVSGAEPPHRQEAGEGAVWVLEDPRAGTAGQAVGIAERLGVPFRRIPLSWNWMAHLAGLSARGSLLGLKEAAWQESDMPPPRLVFSSGSRSIAVALWARARFGCRLVHCMRPQWRAGRFDLLVIPRHDRPPARPNVMPVLAAPHRVSPQLLAAARANWEERLAHMPRPRIALLVGGPPQGTEMQPALGHMLGCHVAWLAAQHGGSVLATTSRRTGQEASDALSAGLSAAMHQIYRWGEPGENPYLGFLALADAVVVTADSVSMISEAAATEAPVFIALPQLAGMRQRRFVQALVRAGQARPLGRTLGAWRRDPLDEAARVAAEIRRRFPLD